MWASHTQYSYSAYLRRIKIRNLNIVGQLKDFHAGLDWIPCTLYSSQTYHINSCPFGILFLFLWNHIFLFASISFFPFICCAVLYSFEGYVAINLKRNLEELTRNWTECQNIETISTK